MKPPKFQKEIIAWTNSFTTDQKLMFSFNNQKEDPKQFESDLPPGSSVSLILFLLLATTA